MITNLLVYGLQQVDTYLEFLDREVITQVTGEQSRFYTHTDNTSNAALRDFV